MASGYLLDSATRSTFGDNKPWLLVSEPLFHSRVSSDETYRWASSRHHHRSPCRDKKPETQGGSAVTPGSHSEQAGVRYKACSSPPHLLPLRSSPFSLPPTWATFVEFLSNHPPKLPFRFSSRTVSPYSVLRSFLVLHLSVEFSLNN